MTLVGCESGLFGTENNSTQVAPNGAISNGLPVTWLNQATDTGFQQDRKGLPGLLAQQQSAKQRSDPGFH